MQRPKMMKTRPTLLILALGAVLAGCGTAPTKTSENEATPVIPPYKGGGYYKDDGPGVNPPANLASVPDAVPKWEPLHRYANDSYKVLGKEYEPIAADKPYKARGLASWYGRKFHGKSTSSGEPYDMYAMSAAHATLPVPSYARVTNLENGKSIVVRVNDRGPFHDGRIIDLSYTAAYKLDILKGVTPVEVESVLPGDPRDAAPTSFSAQSEKDFDPLANATPAVAATPTADKLAEGKVIYLQLGAFSSPDTANNLLQRATAHLSRDFPGVLRIEVNGLYKVQAGPFSDSKIADHAAALILADLGIRAYKMRTDAQVFTADAEDATKPAKPASSGVNVATTTGPGLYLQLAALSNPDAAAALASKVKSRFGESLPGLANVNAGNLYKIQAGPFETAAAAEQLALAYQQDFGVKPYKILR